MDTPTAQLSLLMDLETRHEDLLQRLDDLDQRVQKTLSEWQNGRCNTLEHTQNVVATAQG